MRTKDRPTFPLFWATCIAKHPTSAKSRLHCAGLSLLLAQKRVRSSVRHGPIVIELLRQLFWQCETTLLEYMCWRQGYGTIMCSLMNLFFEPLLLEQRFNKGAVLQQRSTSLQTSFHITGTKVSVLLYVRVKET